MKSSLVFSIAIAMAPEFAQFAGPMPCVDSANSIEKNRCLSREVEDIDKRIAAQLSRIAANLQQRDAGEAVIRMAPAFAASQAKWQEFREVECDS